MFVLKNQRVVLLHYSKLLGYILTALQDRSNLDPSERLEG